MRIGSSQVDILNNSCCWGSLQYAIGVDTPEVVTQLQQFPKHLKFDSISPSTDVESEQWFKTMQTRKHWEWINLGIICEMIYGTNEAT
jgi:hypothetical protein